MAMVTEPASIDGIEFDAIKDTEESYSADAPDYAAEDGFSYGDAIIVKPIELTVNAIVSNSPLTWASRHSASRNRVTEVADQLRDLFTARKLVTYRRAGRAWSNMAITSLKLPHKRENGDSAQIAMTLKQVTITEVKTVTVSVAYSRGGATAVNTGSTSTGSASSGNGSGSATSSGSTKKASVLYSAAKSLGAFG